MSEDELFALIEKALPARAFLILARMGVKEPYLILSPISATPTLTMCGDARAWQTTYRLDAYARTKRDAEQIMERVFALVDDCDGDPMITERQHMYEQDTRIHRVSVVVSTWYQPDDR